MIIDFLKITAAVGSVLAFLNLVFSTLIITKIKRFEKENPESPRRFPRLSLIIPARNEAETIEKSLQSRLLDNYPDLEFILVDDRSTDGTREIIDRISKTDRRVKPVFIDDLPDGWLGKTWALNNGIKNATGEYLLFSDADVYYSPGTLRKAVSICEERKIEHLGLIPHLGSGTFLLNVILNIFMREFPFTTRLWAADNPKSSAYFGLGAFNLVKTTAFKRTEGFEWLRLETVDDLGLGLLLKKSGARGKVFIACRDTRVLWYKNMKGMFKAVERSGFAGYGGYSTLKTGSLGFLYLLLELAPVYALLFFNTPWLQLLGAASCFSVLLASIVISRWSERPILHAFFFPLGIAIGGYAFIRAAFLGAIRGGIYWRDTFYPSKELKKFRRVKLY